MTPITRLLSSLTTPPWDLAGQSVDGRPILIRRFAGEGAPVLVFGGIHGDEPSSAFLVARLAEALARGEGGARRRPCWVVAAANPDGLAAGTKDNARAVDLNRNFPASTWAPAHRPGYHPGEAPASESETRSLLHLAAESGAGRFVAVHAPLACVNPDGPALALATRMAAACGLPVASSIGYPTPGSFGALFARDRDLEVITLELPDGAAPTDEGAALWERFGAALLVALAPQAAAGRAAHAGLVGASLAMQELYELLDRVAPSDATVLVQGENGTGKELVARALHEGSPRRARRFVAQNCAALHDELLDSALFGHRRGAFTGASADTPGVFATAHEGTLFLDEIGDMSPALQVKLLRVLQEGTFTPVGDTEERRVDVRVIAATHRDLLAMVATGTFRQDLYFRINVIQLVVPPLRARRDDIPLLCQHVLSRLGGQPPRRLTPEALSRLAAHSWPGNVRELENELERMVVLAGERALLGEDLVSAHVGPPAGPTAAGDDPRPGLPGALARLERRMLAHALAHSGGNRTQAAVALGISRRNLIRLVRRYGL